MLKEERHTIILNEVQIHSRVLLTDMMRLLGVSADTVRRDLKELDTQKKLRKVHGGAISIGYQPTDTVEEVVYARNKKIRIAKKAISLLKDGNTVLMSGGTTNLELARLIPSHLNLTFFTPSLPVAMQLLAHSNVEVIFIGGKLSHSAHIAIGGSTVQMLSDIKVDLCFLGTAYIDSEEGLSEFDWSIVQLKKSMQNASKRVVVLAISEKLGSKQKYKVCAVRSIDTLITELESSDSTLEPYKEQGIKIL